MAEDSKKTVMTDEQKNSSFNHLSPEDYEKVRKAKSDSVIGSAGNAGLQALGIDTTSPNPGGAVGVAAAGTYGGYAGEDAEDLPEHKVNLSGKPNGEGSDKERADAQAKKDEADAKQRDTESAKTSKPTVNNK